MNNENGDSISVALLSMFQPIYNHTFMLITFNIINYFLKTNILLQNKCPFLSYCIYIYITS